MNSTERQHAEMVNVLAKPGAEICAKLTPSDAHLLHMAVGVSGEAGELLDIFKKLTIYRKPLDEKMLEHIIEELGDLEFYMEGIRQALGVTRENTLAANMDKLAIRYKDYKYTDAQAHARADKAQITLDIHRE